MTKDEALDLALEALETELAVDMTNGAEVGEAAELMCEAIIAIKQARALDKKAENARELGLDYEPVGLIDRLINPEQHYEFTDPKKANAVLMSLCQEAADALAAPVQEPVAWMYESVCGNDFACRHNPPDYAKNIRPLYTTPPAAQPAVPDAFGTREGEHPEYIQGWNDCRAEMLKGMKL
jgi:hypothetical protein